jgi:hypothetical protein
MISEWNVAHGTNATSEHARCDFRFGKHLLAYNITGHDP